MAGMSLVAVLGAVMMIEMLYHVTLNADNGPIKNLFGVAVDTTAPTGWLLGLALLAAGAFGFWRSKPAFQQAWGDVNMEIEAAIRRAEA
jgi:branched-chain amino acid transport system permease protein